MKQRIISTLFIVGAVFSSRPEAFAAVVSTRVTGAASWSAISTWIQNRTGTITASTASTTVTGTGTAFDTELLPGDVLVLQTAPGTVIGTIASIQNATQLTLTANAGANAVIQAYGRQAVPTSSDDVVVGNTALVGAAVTVTLDIASATVNSLTFTSMALANALTHAGVNVLTVLNNATVNQPTAAVTMSWNINGGSTTVNGDVLIGGSNSTASRVSQIAVTTGSLSVTGSVTWASNTNSANELISVTTGTVALGNSMALSSGTLSMTGAGTVNFNGGLAYGGVNNPVLSTAAGSNMNIGGNLGATTALTFNGTSNTTFTNTSTVTPTSAVTFGNVQVNPAVVVTLAGSVTVSGNWTNNGGTLSGGANTVTFSGAAKTIGGTASTSFPAMFLAAGATYTMNNDNSSTSLTFAASSLASSLAQTAGVTLTVNGNVTINQPTAGVTTSWNINAGIGVVNGNISIGGTDLTSARIAQIAVTTGSLTVTGSVTYASNASSATEVISVTTGTITLNNALTLSFGTLSMSGAGTVNFNSGLTYGGVNNPVFSTAAGSNLNIGGNLSAGTTALTLNGTSNTTFTNTSTVTPTSAVTFGNVQINPRVDVMLGGPITVNGNLTLQLKSTLDPQSFGLTLKGNLTTDGIFLPSTSTTTLVGSSSQTVGGLTISEFNHLTVNNSSPSGVTMAQDVVVDGVLTLAIGSLSIGSNTLTLNGAVSKSGGSLVGGNSSNIVVGDTGSSTTLPAVTVNNLILNRASGISLGGNVTVNGALILTTGDLSIGSNTLTLNGVISASNGTLIGGSSSNMTIGSAVLGTPLPGVTLNNLTLNRSAGVNLIGDVTINGRLTFSAGNITTGVSKVIIGPTGSIARASGHVVGNLQKNLAVGANVSRVFEVGDGTNYTPVELLFGQVISSGNLLSTTTIGDHPNISGSGIMPSRSVNRYWTLSNDSATFASYSAKLNFVSNDIDAGANTGNFIVQKFDTPVWSSPALGPRTPTSIQATGMTSFSDFAVGEIVGYTIMASAGAGGTISPSGAVNVLHGSTQKFTLTPNIGYHVSDLFVDGVHKDSTTSYTFVNITANHTITATFAINVYTITATAGSGGTINPSGVVPVNYGTDTTFRITPNIGYFIGDVIVDSVSVGKVSNLTFTNITANHTIDAHFYANTPPTAARILKPINGDTIQLYVIPRPVVFTWQKSNDVDITDTTRYSINVSGPGLDTTINGLTDTSISLNIMPRLQTSSVYRWTVNVMDGFSTVVSPDTFSFRTSSTLVGIDDLASTLPKEYALDQNYPNPFNPSTDIRFAVPARSRVKLEIFNAVGQKIATLVDAERAAGLYDVKWNADVASGLYFYRIEAVAENNAAPSFVKVKKMLFLK